MTKETTKVSEKFIRTRKNKIVRMSVLCYKNSLRLHQDSIYLFRKLRYPSSNALSIIALEEMGKHMLLSNGLFHGYFDSDDDENFISKMMKQTYDHRIKQSIFMNFGWHDVFYSDVTKLKEQNADYGELVDDLFAYLNERNFDNPNFEKYFPNLRKFYKKLHTLDVDKQDSFYVGYPKKKGGEADVDKRLRSPFRIGKKRAEEQITTLNDHILLQALRVLKGVSGFEDWEDELDSMVTSKFVKQLRNNWKIVGKNNKKIVAELSKLPDDKWSVEK